jgi:opine dehydrogenase
MTTLPKEAVVLGSGAGSLTITAELQLAGVQTVIADFPEFCQNIEAVEKAGGITVEFEGDPAGPILVPVAGTSLDPESAAKNRELVIISVPCFGHDPFANLLAPILEDGQKVIWPGEGGGAFATVAALKKLGRRPDVILAETNSLPYGPARWQAPGSVKAKRKTGGTYIAALPNSKTQEIYELGKLIWPGLQPGSNAWETLLLNFNAIDHVATFILNLSQVENRTDQMRFWGEGLSPGVGRVVSEVDHEYTLLRGALGLPTDNRYPDFLVEQGIVDRKYGTTFETMMNGLLTKSTFQCGPDALSHRYITEDVPYSLVLASSLGDELQVPTPVIDSLITLASTASETDFWSQGRTLDTWGLKGAGQEGLVKAVEKGWW